VNRGTGEAEKDLFPRFAYSPFLRFFLFFSPFLWFFPFLDRYLICSVSPFRYLIFFVSIFQIVNQQSEGSSIFHEARMIVPFPSADSIAKEPPESSVRSLMLVRPNPRFALSEPSTFFRSKP
jgi:hypothetical protein